MSKKLYIIMPAYNEEENIQSTLKDWYKVIQEVEDKHSSGCRLVVLNDGSKDNTLKKLNEFKKNHPLLTVIDKKNEGHGPSLIRGYKYAIESGADWIFQTDSDGQTNPKEFGKFWKQRKNYDAIFGHRTERGDGKDRDFVEKTLCKIIRVIFKVKLPDANAPFRLMRSCDVKEFLELMPENYNLPNVILTTFFVKSQKRVKFEEISFKPRTKGKNSINIKKITKIGLKAIPDFLKIRAKSKKKDSSSIAIKAISFLFIFLLSLSLSLMNPQNIFRKNAAPSADNAVFQSVAFHMSKGLMPYRDIFDHKGPLLYIIHYIGFKIDAGWGTWSLELLAIIITLLFIYKASRLYLDRFFSMFVVFLAATISLPYIWNEAAGVEVFALPFISISLFLLLKFLKTKNLSSGEKICAGACLSSVLMLRPNMIATWMVFCLAILIESIKTKSYKVLLDYVLKFFLGLCIIIVPIFAWLITTESFRAFIDCYIGFNSYYSLHSEASTLVNRIKVITDPLLNNQMMFISGLALLFTLISNKTLRKASALTLAIIILSLLTIATSGRSYAHYYTILIPCVTIPFIFALAALSDRIPRYTLGLILILFSITSFMPQWIDQIKNNASLLVHSQTDLNYEQYSNVIDYIVLNSSEDDRIAAWKNSDSIIYTASNRLSATRYPYAPPIISVDEKRAQEYRKQLQEKMPKYVVLPKNDKSAMQYVHYIESLGYTAVNDFSDANFDIFRAPDKTQTSTIQFNAQKIGKVLEDGTLFDPDVFYENDTFYLYVSARSESSIVRYESKDGESWSNKQTIVALDNEPEGTVINRATVLKKEGVYYIYYSTQKDGKSYINVATGTDGIHFKKYKNNPIISPEKGFEGDSTMNANVLYDKGVFKMWYATGETYEPNTISYAESNDGFVWTKLNSPIKSKNPKIYYSRDRVGGPEMFIFSDDYYLFYIGYSNIDTGYVMLSRSPDGISNFTDYELPLVSSDFDGFDQNSVYKPTVYYDKDSDLLYLWYNGRTQGLETIGLVKINDFTKTLQELGL